VTPGQYPPAEQVIVHLSDTHLTAQSQPLLGMVDADPQARLMLEPVAAELGPQLVWVMGNQGVRTCRMTNAAT